MPEGNEKPLTNLLDQSPIPDKTPDKKPNIIASTIGKIALVGAAIGVVGAGARARQADSPAQPIKDAVNISRQITDNIIPKDDKPEEQNTIPATNPITEPQSAVGEEAASTDPDLTELNKIFDTFVDDLKQIPASRMLGMGDTGIEGYKVAVGEKTIKFMLKPSESDHNLDKITVEIATDAEVKTWEIIGQEIEYQYKSKDTSKPNEEAPAISKSTAEILTEELRTLHEQWTEQRGKNGENVTSSIQTIPPENAQFTEPTPMPTETPEPTPTPNPVFDPIGPHDRDAHDASLDQSTPEPSTPQETTVQAPINPPTEVQSSQPVNTETTAPKADL